MASWTGATSVLHGRPCRRGPGAGSGHGTRGTDRAAAPLAARALRSAAQPAAFPEACLADQPRAHRGRSRVPAHPGVPARGHALHREADHRPGPAARRVRPRRRHPARMAGQRSRRSPPRPPRPGAGPGRPLRRPGPRGLPSRRAAFGAVLQHHQHPPHGARGHPGPGGLRGQRAAGPPGPRAPPDHGPHHADEPDLRPGPGRGDHRQLRHRPRRVRAVADRPARARPRARVPGRGALPPRAIRSTTRGRRSAASSTTCARRGPASRPRRK